MVQNFRIEKILSFCTQSGKVKGVYVGPSGQQFRSVVSVSYTTRNKINQLIVALKESKKYD